MANNDFSATSKWFIPFEDLDTDQQRLVKDGLFKNNNSIGWIMGPAGSGKTIILVNALEKAKENGKKVVFISYTHSLLNMARQGLSKNVEAMTFYKAVNKEGGWDLAVIDEVQDIPLNTIELITKKSKKVLIAGDEFQRIYAGGATKDELIKHCKDNFEKLIKSYRLTPRVHAAANEIYPKSLEGVKPSGKTVTDIKLFKTSTVHEGYKICYLSAFPFAQKKKTSVILLPTRELIIEFANWALNEKGAPAWRVHWVNNNGTNIPYWDNLNEYLKKHNVFLEVVQNGNGDLGAAFGSNNIILQTYHSSKGLDYQHVFLPNLDVEAAVEESYRLALFFVAITRASGTLTITQQEDNISSYVKKIEPFCTPTSVEKTLTILNSNDDEF